ncbi:cyclophilin-like fold protein [Entomomonas sp. E2T0]|uniref:cyclophilin-like fold protein n=1 Tax=Entomomonas sp. E2T0 TaxID=2930213 RepID=UPI002228297C|nr:cyclophilin-like fold protein [Entomomonas sp. E2T0]UYZ82729.1 cyclophilin-like fold protein [Entomomonas sp. E2T0]
MNTSNNSRDTVIARIKVTFANNEVVVSLFDTAASHELLAQLPLTLSFSDFSNTEKIAYPPKKLTTHNTPNAEQTTGDFTYYAPWGNLAIFYKGNGHGTQLYVLGRIESGKEKLVTMKRDFNAVIELID